MKGPCVGIECIVVVLDPLSLVGCFVMSGADAGTHPNGFISGVV